MSDQAVAEALDDLERLLDEPLERMDGARIADWHARFRQAVETAERGPGWPDLVARAHALGQRMERCLAQAISQQEALRQALTVGQQGARALQAYRPRGV